MISWSDTRTEYMDAHLTGEGGCMTSFAVVKDQDADRLNPWLRKQNSLFMEPPEVDLPDPSLFARLHVASKSRASGFACDVSNMFHNTKLPGCLVPYFPLKTVAFGNLSGSAQQNLIQQLCLRKRPPQNVRFRPHQCTVAMRWSWALAIAHGVSSGVIKRAVAITRATLHNRIQFRYLMRMTRNSKLEDGDILVLRVIDDINIVGFVVSSQALCLFQRALYEQLTVCGLPLKATKSNAAGILSYKTLPFIGYVWDLENHVLEPKEGRAESVRACCTYNSLLFSSWQSSGTNAWLVA